MPKLTPELIEQTPSRINPLKDRELDLRGLKIPAIENLGVTKDQFSTLILSHNLIHSIPPLPSLPHLTTLVLSHNLIASIHPSISKSLPRLTTLVLDHNRLGLGELNALADHPSLTYLDLRSNKCADAPRYREWLIHRLPKLRVLDYEKVKDSERAQSRALFLTADKRPTALATEILALAPSAGDAAQPKDNTFVPGGESAGAKGRLLTPEERERVRKAIISAGSVDEVRRLERLLRDGFVPGGEGVPV